MKRFEQLWREPVGSTSWRIALAHELSYEEMFDLTWMANDSVWLQTHFPELYVWLSFHPCPWCLMTHRDFFPSATRSNPVDHVWLMLYDSKVDRLFWETWGCDEIS